MAAAFVAQHAIDQASQMMGHGDDRLGSAKCRTVLKSGQECVGEDGKQYAITVGTIERLAGSTTAENLGVNLQESKQIVNRLQETVVKQQLQELCERRRKCLTCGRPRLVKDYRQHRVDTVKGTVCLRVPRYRCCRCSSSTQVWNPASEPLSSRVTPELRHLQVSLGAQTSYRKAPDLLRMLLPPIGRNYPYHHKKPGHRGRRAHRRRDSARHRRESQPDKPAKHMIIS